MKKRYWKMVNCGLYYPLSVFLLLSTFVTSCGGSSGNNLIPDPSLGQISKTEKMLFSASYDGSLVVNLGENAQLNHSKSIGDAEFYKSTPIYSVLDKYPSITASPLDDSAQTLAGLSVEEAQKQKKLREIKFTGHTGSSQPKWNSLVNLEIADPNEALRVLRELSEQQEINYIYPNLKTYPSTIQTPSLVGGQTYITNDVGSLGVRAVWNAVDDEGYYEIGENVWIINHERGVDTRHEDLGISDLAMTDEGRTLGMAEGGLFLHHHPECDPVLNAIVGELSRPDWLSRCAAWVSHGTAVMGIIGGVNNHNGVIGIAPGARKIGALYDSIPYSHLQFATDGYDRAPELRDDDIEPGSIWVIEFQFPGLHTENGCGGPTAEDQAGCMPAEFIPTMHSAISQAIDYGVTVIMGAGNGGVNLDADENYSENFHDFRLSDSGSIMVGASTGPDMLPINGTNYGSSVELFAWGQNVATTAYDYEGTPLVWNDDPNSPIPPNDEDFKYYVNNFGGTSAAAAMVGGVASLVQSYAKKLIRDKQLAGLDEIIDNSEDPLERHRAQRLRSKVSERLTAYLMPHRVKQILLESGVAQADLANSDDPSFRRIGVQPRAEIALQLVEQFIEKVFNGNDQVSGFSELSSGRTLTDQRRLELRSGQEWGVGLICQLPGSHQAVDGVVDLSCGDSLLWPKETLIAKELDFDGDGRADLISWTNGTLKLDLSSEGEGDNNYGAWDAEINHPVINGQWVWSYMHDMDSDGRSDIVIYDREHGIWYIKYTTNQLLFDSHNVEFSWDAVIPYEDYWQDNLALDPNNSLYSRPMPADYNLDGLIDIAIACSDGVWRVDYNSKNGFDGLWDLEIQYLTEDQLSYAPGWAYLPYVVSHPYRGTLIGYKVPDDLQAEQYESMGIPAGAVLANSPQMDYEHISADLFGGNEVILLGGKYVSERGRFVDLGVIDLAEGTWGTSRAMDVYSFVEDLGPIDILKDGCYPVAADYDGDGLADRAAFCADGWKVVLSSNDSEVMELDLLGYDPDAEFALPGRPYYGGLSYAKVKEKIALSRGSFQDSPPSIPVDMDMGRDIIQ